MYKIGQKVNIIVNVYQVPTPTVATIRGIGGGEYYVESEIFVGWVKEEDVSPV